MGNPLTILLVLLEIRYVSYFRTKFTGKVRFLPNHALSTCKRAVPNSSVQYSTVQYSKELLVSWCLEHGFIKKVRNVPY